MITLSVIVSLAVPFLAAFCYFGGYGKLRNWMNVRLQRISIIFSLIENLNQEKSRAKKNTVSFVVNDSDLSATIIYERLGTQYILLVPYNRSYIADMSQFRVELLRNDKEPLNITQQPGIPYMINAGDLGGHSIRITDEETGVSHVYNQVTCPRYGTDVILKNKI